MLKSLDPIFFSPYTDQAFNTINLAKIYFKLQITSMVFNLMVNWTYSFYLVNQETVIYFP